MNRHTSPPTSSGTPPSPPGHSLKRRLLSGALSLGLVVAVFVFLIPNLTSASLSETLAELTPASVVVATLLGILSLFTNWMQIVASLPGLRIREAAVQNTASAAVSNTLPEGGVFGTGLTYGMYHSWGFGVSPATSSIMTTGIFNQVFRYALLALALVILTFTDGTARLGLTIVILVLVLVASWVLFRLIASEPFALRFGRLAERLVNPVLRLVHRGPTDLVTGVQQFRARVERLVTSRWRSLSITTIFVQLSTVLVLGVALRMMGIGEDEVSWALVMAAYGGMSLVNLVSPTPGGVGTSEAALIAVIGTAVPPSQDAAMNAAVLLFRYATWFVPIVLGIPAYLFWRFNHSWRRPVSDELASPAPTRHGTDARGAP